MPPEELAKTNTQQGESVTCVKINQCCKFDLPTDETIKAVALTVYAEATGRGAGGTAEEKRATADAIYNRTTVKEFPETVMKVLAKPGQIHGYMNDKYKRGENIKNICQGVKGRCNVEQECQDLKDSISAAEAAAISSAYPNFLYWNTTKKEGRTHLGGNTYFRDYYRDGKPNDKERQKRNTRDGKPYKSDVL